MYGVRCGALIAARSRVRQCGNTRNTNGSTSRLVNHIKRVLYFKTACRFWARPCVTNNMPFACVGLRMCRLSCVNAWMCAALSSHSFAIGRSMESACFVLAIELYLCNYGLSIFFESGNVPETVFIFSTQITITSSPHIVHSFC